MTYIPDEKLQHFWDELGDRYARLIGMGGPMPEGYGTITPAPPPYGKSGLSHEEYLEHIQLNYYAQGMIAILGLEASLWLACKLHQKWIAHLDLWQLKAIDQSKQIEKVQEIAIQCKSKITKQWIEHTKDWEKAALKEEFAPDLINDLLNEMTVGGNDGKIILTLKN